MKDTEYTFAVARIRANETHFIGKNEMEQLLLAPDLRAALQLLADQGWETQGALEDPNEMLREQAARMWSLLTEVAPDVGELSFLTAKNDFHNLKACIEKPCQRSIPGALLDAPQFGAGEAHLGGGIQPEFQPAAHPDAAARSAGL